MSELQAILQQHPDLFAIVGKILAWIGGARLLVKPFNALLLGGLHHAVVFVQQTPEQDDDALLFRVLSHRLYRLFVFLVDLLTSVKLPTAASLQLHVEQTKA